MLAVCTVCVCVCKYVWDCSLWLTLKATLFVCHTLWKKKNDFLYDQLSLCQDWIQLAHNGVPYAGSYERGEPLEVAWLLRNLASSMEFRRHRWALSHHRMQPNNLHIFTSSCYSSNHVEVSQVDSFSRLCLPKFVHWNTRETSKRVFDIIIVVCFANDDDEIYICVCIYIYIQSWAPPLVSCPRLLTHCKLTFASEALFVFPTAKEGRAMLWRRLHFTLSYQ